MLIEPEISSASIVLVGKFNPAIFHPSWFALQGIMSRAQADAATTEVVHPDLTVIQEEATKIQVEPTRFTVETRIAPFVTIADFVAKTFGENLTHTPVRIVGINRQMHFRLAEAEDRVKMGRRLAPLEPWGEWGTRLAAARTGERIAGMSSLTMQEPFDREGYACHYQVQVGPSTAVRGPNGVQVYTNFQFAAPGPDNAKGCLEIVRFMYDVFDDEIRNAEWMTDELLRASLTLET